MKSFCFYNRRAIFFFQTKRDIFHPGPVPPPCRWWLSIINSPLEVMWTIQSTARVQRGHRPSRLSPACDRNVFMYLTANDDSQYFSALCNQNRELDKANNRPLWEMLFNIPLLRIQMEFVPGTLILVLDSSTWRASLLTGNNALKALHCTWWKNWLCPL